MRTKDRILETALKLFNENGVSEVSTHHIASQCVISPGNLYYHYNNKKEIIRALFDQALLYISEQDKITNATKQTTTSSIEASLAFLNTLNWRYRFLKRDLPIILMNDPQLREKFHAIHQQQVNNLNRDLRKAITDGFYRELSPTDTIRLSKIFWLVALFFPTFLEVSGDEYTQENMVEGVDLIRLLINIMLTDKGKEQIRLEENK